MGNDVQNSLQSQFSFQPLAESLIPHLPPFTGKVWEPAAANGQLAYALAKAGLDVFTSDIRTWAGSGHVYLVGAESEVRRLIGSASKAEEITIVKRVSIPQIEQPEPRVGGFGGPGGPPGVGGNRRNRMFAGPGGGGGGPGGPGGPMSFAFNVKEYVIAEWKPAR